MRSIVTDPSKDYIYGDNFTDLANHLEELITRACRTVTPTTTRPTTTPLSAIPAPGLICDVFKISVALW